MADESQFIMDETASTSTVNEEVEIVLGKTLSDERKLELIHQLRKCPFLWETSSPAYRVDTKTKEKVLRS